MGILAKGLVVKKEWASLIFEGDSDGRKLLEVRGSSTGVRGRVGIIESGSGLVVGSVEICGCMAFTRQSFEGLRAQHKLKCSYWELPYRAPCGWELRDAYRFPEPVPYRHPQGAVIWVKLFDVWDQFPGTGS